MSRTKTTDTAQTEAENAVLPENNSVPEQIESAEKEQEKAKEDSVKAEGSETESYQKISVIQYLELNPQSVYIAALMKKNYEMKFNSKSDWDLLLQKLIGKKIN
jgi:hypothetical protein